MEKKLLFDEAMLPGGKKYELGGWRELPEVVHDEHNIKGFFGEYRWLSNFGKASVELDGIEYASVEKAYQAAKYPPGEREFFTACTNRESIIYVGEHPPRASTTEEWSTKKLEVMAGLLEQKFDPEHNPENAVKLADTGDKYLEETNWWGDMYWGRQLNGEGENNLGKLLMTIRAGYNNE